MTRRVASIWNHLYLYGLIVSIISVRQRTSAEVMDSAVAMWQDIHTMETFAKLLSSIVTSTIWCEDSDTKVVWVTMLALADKNGYVGASVPGLAKLAGVSLQAAETAIGKFLGPDPMSRSKEHEGRRIVESDRGWTLLNYAKVRDMRHADDRREQNREAQQRKRNRAKSAERRAIEAYDAGHDNLAPDHVYELDERWRTGSG